MLRVCRSLTALLACLLLVTLLCAASVSAQDTEDSRMFLAGFNAFQQKEYPAAIARFDEVLKKYPDTPLRDMTLFWLARAHYNTGNRQDAARYMAQFTREYPDNPLKNTVEDDLLSLAAQYQKAQGSVDQVALAKQAEAEKAKAAAETERVAKEKLEADRLAQAKAAQDAAEKARLLKAKAEEARLAREKAEADRLAALKAEQEKQKAAAEAERIAREKAEADKIAAAKAEADRVAQEKAAQEAAEKARVLKAKAEAARLAKEKEAAEQRAAQQVAEERRSAEKAAAAAAAQKEQELAAARKLEADRVAAEHARLERARMKEKAIAEYKGILERFPGTAAARTAATRLKGLGVAIALPPATPVQSVAGTETSGTSQTLTLEVAQYAAFEFDLQPPAAAVAVAQKTAVPFELQNRGNGQDSFYLVSGFPAEFGARFAAAAAPEQVINQTPLLAPGETFKGLLLLSVPPATIDGLRIAYPVKAASQFMGEASQSRVVSLVAAAPLLRAVVKTDKTQLLPGEKADYTITVLNVGSTPAQDVTLRLSFPAQYQPVEGAVAGFRQEMQAALVQDGLTLKPGESRNLSATFQLKDEALAKEELIVRADLVNNALQTKGTFLSNAAFVLPVSDLALRMAQERVTAVPGQTVSIPARVVNKGNQRERISLVATAGPFQKITIYHDLNRDGLRQPGEPEVTSIGPLGPKEEDALLLEVSTPKNARDGAVEKVSLTAAPETSQGKMVMAEAQIGYSRPVLQLAMKGREGRMVPGELLTVELDILNQGSNLAKQVELEVTWPDQIELVAADQAAGKTLSGASIWRFNELGAGEKRLIKASFRIKPGTSVGTGVQLKSMLTYQDQAGNRY